MPQCARISHLVFRMPRKWYVLCWKIALGYAIFGNSLFGHVWWDGGMGYGLFWKSAYVVATLLLQSPDLPPCFSLTRTSLITIPRSTALHMS